MDPIQLVLGTRTGHRSDPARYDQCKWNLIHPILPPSNEYETTVSLSYVSMPGDRDRLNADRNSVDLYFLENDNPDGLDDWRLIEEPVISIRPGSYTTSALANILNESEYMTGRNLLVKVATDSGRFKMVTTDLSDTNRWRIATRAELGFESLSDAMGYMGYGGEWQEAGYADRPPDLQGTRTLTIRSNLGSNHVDPMTLSHRSNILAVIPADTGDINRATVWENKYYTAQRVSGKVVDTIELFLEDDMGLRMDPTNHWSVCLEFRFRKHGIESKASVHKRFKHAHPGPV